MHGLNRAIWWYVTDKRPHHANVTVSMPKILEKANFIMDCIPPNDNTSPIQSFRLPTVEVAATVMHIVHRGTMSCRKG